MQASFERQKRCSYGSLESKAFKSFGHTETLRHKSTKTQEVPSECQETLVHGEGDQELAQAAQGG